MGSFADDMNLWSKSIQKPRSIKKKKIQMGRIIQEMKEFQHWTRKWKLVLNPDKCYYTLLYKSLNNNLCKEFIKVDKNGNASLREKYCIKLLNNKNLNEEVKLKHKTNKKYLGIPIDNKLSYESHYNKVKQSFGATLANIIKLNNNRNKKLCKKATLAIFNAKAISKFNYGAILTINNDKKIKELNKIQNKYIAVATHRKRGTPGILLNHISNQKPLKELMRFELLKQYARVMHAPPGHPLQKVKILYDKLSETENGRKWKSLSISRIMKEGFDAKNHLSINKAITKIPTDYYKAPQTFTHVPNESIEKF